MSTLRMKATLSRKYKGRFRFVGTILREEASNWRKRWWARDEKKVRTASGPEGFFAHA